MEERKLVLWADASIRYNGTHTAAIATGIAVVDTLGRVHVGWALKGMGTTMAERLSIMAAFRVAREQAGRREVEVRTDSDAAFKGLTAPRGVAFKLCDRNGNAAHSEARRFAGCDP